MRDYINIGSSPPEEECAQVGSPGYAERTRVECIAYRDQLRRTLGPEPDGAEFRIKSFPHDFGSYLEVVCWFDDSLPDSLEYALECESQGPLQWDDAAKRQLAGYPADAVAP